MPAASIGERGEVAGTGRVSPTGTRPAKPQSNDWATALVRVVRRAYSACVTLLDRPRPAARGRGTRAGRSRGGVLLLPPWTRAPWLAFGTPAVILAVLGAAAILAAASSSAALFLSSASSESLRVQLAAECGDAAYPQLQQVILPLSGKPATDEKVRSAMRAQGLNDPQRLVVTSGSVPIRDGNQQTLGRMIYRDGAVRNIDVLDSTAGSGLYLPEFTAQRLGASLGDTIVSGTFRAPVVGIYTDLFREQTRRPYWCSYGQYYLNEASVDPPPPALVIATDPTILDALERSLGGAYSTTVDRSWISPIDTRGLTLSEAQTIDAERDRAFATSGIDNRFGHSGDTGLLPEMAARTALITNGLRGPVIPIALGGSILALLLVAAAGSYWADRRSREVRLLSSRGVGPAALAGKAALELAVPALAGTVLGWLLARWLITLIGPSPYVDASAPWQAAITAAVGLVIGLALLALVAGLRARGATEKPIGARRSWAAKVPWEVLLLAAALLSYLRLLGQDGVVIENNVAQVNLLLVSFPLLFLAGAAVLVVRLLAATLPRLRRRAGRWGPAAYLAVSRVAASRLISAGLLAAVSMPIGVLVYGAALTGTSSYTLAAKAHVVVGSDVAVISVDPIAATPELAALGTIVTRYPLGTVNGQRVTVLAVDPGSFEKYAYWDNRFSAESLAGLLAGLDVPEASGAVPAIAMGLDATNPTVSLGKRDIAMDVTGVAGTFPGRRSPDPMLIVDKKRLGEIDRTAGEFSEVWSTSTEQAVRAGLPEQVRVLGVQSTGTVFRVANFLSVSWTFDYLRALAAFVGVVAIGGLLLYLETRQRSRVASYALARRMGLTATAHFRSLVAELSVLLSLAFVVGGALAWAAVLVVYRMLEIDPTRPPGPLLTTPTVTVLIAAAATLVVALLTAAYAQRAASRADMAEVLRLGS